MSSARRIAVIGGGLAGLTAAYELAAAGANVVVLEATDRVGGKLRAEDVGGVSIDVGAESILARRPEALELMDRVGLPYEPARTTTASIWSYGELRTMPKTVLGIPGDAAELIDSGIVREVTPAIVAVDDERDVSVAEFVSARLGQDVVDRLVEPLLGGVYAGHADRLSLRSAAPQIAALGSDLLSAAANAIAAAPKSEAPVFVAPTGGVHRLPEALASQGTFEIRLNKTVRAFERTESGWQLIVGPAHELETVDADLVIVATPGSATARLLSDAAPEAAFALADLDYASVAIISFVFDGGPGLGTDRSGFLVPPVEGTTIKAATCSTNKWNWTRDAADGRVVIRTSVGRAGETLLLHHDDATVAEMALADLRAIAGSDLDDPIATHVQRWGGALPQYEVGHAELVATVERAVAEVPGLEVCGAAYHGMGIPAVIASAQAAARRLLDEQSTED